jgi:hypothetical protein
MKMMRYLLYAFLNLLLLPSFAQTDTTIASTLSDPGPVKQDQHAVDRFHQVLRYNEPIMYLAFPIIEPIVDRSYPLQEGEGKDGYWAEGHFGHRFLIYKGKYYNAAFFQRMRWTFDVSILTRLTRDDSSPLLPYSNRFGIGLDYMLSSLSKLEEGNSGILWATFQLHHYSNGQADSFFLDVPAKRNNYRTGDFSSNYWRGMLNFSTNPNKKNIYLFGAGYQQELDMDGPLSSSKQLKNYYGDGRALFYFQWHNRSMRQVERSDRSVRNGKTMITKDVKRHIGFRSELEYLTGNMSQFPHDNKYRLGWHNYLTYMPAVSNEIGFMVHTYLGRDYLNIRFDDIIFGAAAGLYIFFN